MTDVPDLLHTPLADRAHEALRVTLVSAIDDLAAQVQRIDDTFLLLTATAGMARGTLNVSQTAQATFAQVQAAITGLGKQVAALSVRMDADKIRDTTAQSGVDGLQDAVAALTARVAALEAYDVPPSQA